MQKELIKRSQALKEASRYCLECSSLLVGSYAGGFDAPDYNDHFCTNKCARSFSSHAFNPSKEWADHVTERGESVI